MDCINDASVDLNVDINDLTFSVNSQYVCISVFNIMCLTMDMCVLLQIKHWI